MPDDKFGFCTITNNGKLINIGTSKIEVFRNIVDNKNREVLRLDGKYFSILLWATLAYFYFTKNSIQSILTAIKKNIDLEEYKILIPENAPEFIDEYSSLLIEWWYKINFIKVPMDKNLSCEEIIFTKIQNNHSKEMAQYFRKFRDKVLDLYPISQEKILSKIYISRNDAGHGRAVYNEDGVMHELSKLGYTRVYLSNYSIKEKIQLFSAAKEIIFPHGAGGVHLVYASPDAKNCGDLAGKWLQTASFIYCM